MLLKRPSIQGNKVYDNEKNTWKNKWRRFGLKWVMNIIKQSIVVLNLAWIHILSTIHTHCRLFHCKLERSKGCALLFMLMMRQYLCVFHPWLMNKHIYHWFMNLIILNAYSVQCGEYVTFMSQLWSLQASRAFFNLIHHKLVALN